MLAEVYLILVKTDFGPHIAKITDILELSGKLPTEMYSEPFQVPEMDIFLKSFKKAQF